MTGGGKDVAVFSLSPSPVAGPGTSALLAEQHPEVAEWFNGEKTLTFTGGFRLGL